MTIVADSREPDKHPFDTEELPAGDYVVTGPDSGIIIERKEWTDLVGSLRSGKIYQQLRMCKEQDYRVVLLIEGDRRDAIRYANSSNYELRRFITSLVANSPEIELLYSKDYNETINIVEDLEEWLGDDSEHTHSVREAEKVPFSKRPQYVIEGLPGVGPKTAQLLLEEFETVENVITASKGELQRVEGIGPKTSAKIRDACT